MDSSQCFNDCVFGEAHCRVCNSRSVVTKHSELWGYESGQSERVKSHQLDGMVEIECSDCGEWLTTNVFSCQDECDDCEDFERCTRVLVKQEEGSMHKPGLNYKGQSFRAAHHAHHELHDRGENPVVVNGFVSWFTDRSLPLWIVYAWVECNGMVHDLAAEEEPISKEVYYSKYGVHDLKWCYDFEQYQESQVFGRFAPVVRELQPLLQYTIVDPLAAYELLKADDTTDTTEQIERLIEKGHILDPETADEMRNKRV